VSCGDRKGSNRRTRNQGVAGRKDLSADIERKSWPLSPKIQFYLLTPNLHRDRKIELMWNVMKAGGVMEMSNTHGGEECGLIIQGRLEFRSEKILRI
jgi:hypothetical protein